MKVSLPIKLQYCLTTVCSGDINGKRFTVVGIGLEMGSVRQSGQSTACGGVRPYRSESVAVMSAPSHITFNFVKIVRKVLSANTRVHVRRSPLYSRAPGPHTAVKIADAKTVVLSATFEDKIKLGM